MATDHGAVPPVEHDDMANLRLALMEKWREACGRAAEGFGRAGTSLLLQRAVSPRRRVRRRYGKSGRIAEAAVAMLADALMDMDPQGYAERPEKLSASSSASSRQSLRGRARRCARRCDVRDASSRRDRRCDPDALPAVPENLVGPSDTATCTIDILDGSQEQPRGAGQVRRHYDGRQPRYRRLLLHHVHAARRIAQDGHLLQDTRLPQSRMRGSELIPTTGADAASGPPNRNGWEPRAAGFDVGGGGIAWMPFMVESQGGIHGGYGEAPCARRTPSGRGPAHGRVQQVRRQSRPHSG